MAETRQSGWFRSAREWTSHSALRLYVVLLLVTVLPVALFSLYADRVLARETEKQAVDESMKMAQLSAYFLQDHFRQSTALLQSYAIDPRFQQAWARRDLNAIQAEMEQVHALQPDFLLVSVYEADGTMRAIAPADKSLPGRKYAFRDWYQGVTRNWKPYVSEVYRPQAAPHALSVAVAVPIKDTSGKPIGIIAAAYSLERITMWLKANVGGSRTISVVDQNGQLLAGPEIDVFSPPVDLSSYEPVRRVRHGETGSGVFSGERGEMFVAYAPLGDLGWGVLAQQPAGAVHQQIWDTRRQVLLIAFLFAVLALVGGSVVGSMYRTQQTLRDRVNVLADSESRYRSLIEGATYGIYRSDERGFVSVNPALVQMLGYASEAEVLKVDVPRDLYVDPEERRRLMDEYAKNQRIKSLEVLWKRKDGAAIHVRLSGRAVHDEAGEPLGFEMIAEDITERRTLEERLRQSQKMEAIGRLAGGVAHDFNNLLTVITGYNQLLMDNLGEEHPLRGDLDEVRKAADRAASLTKQLLAFSRQQVLAPKVLDLNIVVESMKNLLERLLGEDIELLTILQPRAGHVKADPGQLGQVIMNLAVNARDAMPGGGRLTIESANVSLDATYGPEHFYTEPGEYVLLAVSDSGVGMDAETRSHIFEPFYTTKAAGKGTGLGLSTVYGIVQQSGGYIYVESEPGKGSTFKVYLPRVAEVTESAATSATGGQRRGSETVLLVEDEDGVRALTRHLLEKHGYTVLEARSGLEALPMVENCARIRHPIHLLLTDVVMQHMNGRQLAEEIDRRFRGIKVLYMSGYTDDAVLQRGVFAGGTAFLQKPFSAEDLVAKVRELLDLPATLER
jgi:PAS domain S-box-containing protein